MLGYFFVVVVFVKGGLYIVFVIGDEVMIKVVKMCKVSLGMKCSFYLICGGRDMDDDDDDEEFDVDDFEFDDEEDDDSDLVEDLFVLGYVVVSNRWNVDFYVFFLSVDEGDYFIDGEFIKFVN